MKKSTAKEFASLGVIVLAAVVFALAFVNGSSVMAFAENKLLLLTLTLCGAVLNGINGFGRRTVGTGSRENGSRRGPQSGVALTS
jgi:hypothetical protein